MNRQASSVIILLTTLCFSLAGLNTNHYATAAGGISDALVGNPRLQATCPTPSAISNTTELSDCIDWANTNAGAETLGLDANITLTALLPSIDTKITLNGNGMYIDGGGARQVFYVTSNGTFSIDNITIQNGISGLGGGIRNDGVLTVTNSTFSNNTGRNGGGGIYNDGLLTVTNSTFTNNVTGQFDTAGGGILNFNGTATVAGTIFSANVAFRGGGIRSDNILTVSNSTFIDNIALTGGGGLNVRNGFTALTNNTFSGNSAVFGGAIRSSYNVTTAAYNTFYGNSASEVGTGGGIDMFYGLVYLAGNILEAGPSGNSQCRGNLTDNGYNLSSDDTCNFGESGAPGSADNATLNLGSLVNSVHTPDDSSDAVGNIPYGTEIDNSTKYDDFGSVLACNQSMTDQLGIMRPIYAGYNCTSGAVEVNASATMPNEAPTATFNNTSGTIQVGQVATLSFSNQFDPNPEDVAAGFSYSYDCTNDGVFEVSDSSNPSYSCPYNARGNFTARGRIADQNGGYSDYTAAVTVDGPEQPGTLVYFTDFESGAGSEWLPNITTVTPIGNRRFLGEFENATATLNLSGLPAHEEIIITFDLFILKSWDGNPYTDFWSLAVDGQEIFKTTFDTQEFLSVHRQSYPDPYPVGDYTPRTGAKENNTLGYAFEGTPLDSVYGISMTVPHSASSLAIDFTGSELERGIIDESWGLDNMEIRVVSYELVANDDQYETNEDQTLEVGAPGVLANDTPFGFSSITAAPLTNPANGVVVLNPDGSFTYNANPDFNGQDGFTYQLCDAESACVPASVAITVNPVNDAPTFVKGPDLNIDESSGPQVVPNWASQISAGPADEAAQGLVFEVLPSENSFFTSEPVVAPDGTLTYTPDIDANGVVTVSVQLIDDGGAENGGADRSPVETFLITISNVPPTATFTNTSGTIQAGQVAALSFTGQYDPSPADMAAGFLYSYDCDGDGVFEAEAVAAPLKSCPYASVGTFTARGRIIDRDGDYNEYDVEVVVLEPNLAPIAADDAITTDEDTPVTASLTANDSDPDGNLDPTTLSVITPPTLGTLTNNADGSIIYTPSLNNTLPDSFTYQVCDTLGLCAEAAVSITINPINDMPVANDDTAVTDEDVPVTILVLDNDSDVDGDQLVVASVTAGGKGSVVNNGLSVSYTPYPNENGNDSFSYTINDLNGGTATAVVSITIIPVNDPPNAQNDTSETLEDVPVVIPVLANDWDVDGDPVVIVGFTQPNSGTVTLNGDGTLTYTPVQNTNGSDTFTYTIGDPSNATASATVTVNVVPVNDPPVLGINEMSVTANEGALAANSGSVSDIDGDNVNLLASIGTATNNGNGTWSWSFGTSDGPSESQTVTVTASDPGNLSAQVTFTLTVSNVAPTAQFTNTTGTIFRGETATLSFSSQTDPSAIDAAAGFSYSYDCDNNGAFEFSGPDPSFGCLYPVAGTYVAQGVIADKDGGTTAYTAEVHVLAPTEAVQTLVDVTNSFNLQQGIDNSLDAKLQSALDALNDVNGGDTGAAINKLNAFINEVEAQRNKKITDAQATELISIAQRIIATLS